MSLYKKIAALLLISILLTLQGLKSDEIIVHAAQPKSFRTCAELRSVYASGISGSSTAINKGAGPIAKPVVNSSVLRKNLKLDIDKDGIVCELILKSSQPKATFSDNAESISLPLSACQLREQENFTGAGAKGFPARRSVPAVGKIKVAVIPVDFSNAVGVGTPSALFKDDVDQIEKWAPFFSRGKMHYQVEFSGDRWIRAPKGADWYVCVECQKGATEQKQPRVVGIQELINAADASYNFAGVQLIYFIFPMEAEQKFGTAVFASGQMFSSSDGNFTASVYGEMGAGVGALVDRSQIWDHAIHEFLHYQGFIGHGPENGSPNYISTNQWGTHKAVTSWEAFLNGWFDNNEILCIAKDDIDRDIYLTMSSLDNFGANREALMIRLSDEELIVVELRQNGPFTAKCQNCRLSGVAGFTAYRVNVNKAHYRDDRDPEAESKNFWAYLREKGQVSLSRGVEYSGVVITPVTGTQIRISSVT